MFDFDVIQRSWQYLFLEGMRFTLMLTVLSGASALVLGTLIAMVRLSEIPVLAPVLAGFVNLMRALPLILVIFWFYFLVPYIGQWLTGASRPIPVGPFLSAYITFTLFEAAYFSEIMRAGILAVPPGQVAAGKALGLRYRQVMANVVLPQAFRNVFPILITQLIILFQDTSLVYVLSMTDFLGAASKIAQRDGRLFEMYVFAAVVYFIICFALSQLAKRYSTRMLDGANAR